MSPKYVARKSILPAFTFWRVIFFWLIIPTILIIADIIKLKCQDVEFYDSYVIQKSGVFNKTEKKTIFPKITGVNCTVNFFGFGDVNVDVIGKWDVSLTAVSKPRELRSFLESRMVDSSAVDAIGSSTIGTLLG